MHITPTINPKFGCGYRWHVAAGRMLLATAEYKPVLKSWGFFARVPGRRGSSYSGAKKKSFLKALQTPLNW